MACSNDQVLAEMNAARVRAEAVLRGLLEAQSECERQLQDEHRRDAMKLVSGRSSLENAVAATRRMIESFDRQIQELLRAGGEGAGAGPGVAGPICPGPGASALASPGIR